MWQEVREKKLEIKYWQILADLMASYNILLEEQIYEEVIKETKET